MSIIQTRIFYISIIFVVYLIFATAEKKTSIFTIKAINSHTFNLSRDIFWLIGITVLVIPLVQRNCGADTPVYYFDYEHDRMYNFDIAFPYLLQFLHLFIPNAKVGLGIVSTLTVCIALISIIHSRDNVDLPLAIFAYCTQLYFYSYNYMRMMFAVSFIIMGYSLIIQGKRILCTIPFLIAPFFHLSSLIVLIIHFSVLFFESHKRIVILMYGIISFLFLSSPGYWLSLISIERYSEYINNATYGLKAIGVGTLIKAAPIIYIFSKYYISYYKEHIYTWIVIFTIGNILFSFIGYFVGVASRISNFLLVFHIIYGVPWIIKRENRKNIEQQLRIFYILYCILLYYNLSRNFERMMIVPYY